MKRAFAAMFAFALLASPAYSAAPFNKAPLSDYELGKVFGTGVADRNFRLLIDEEATLSRATIFNAAHDAMDAWWAYTGSALIAPNLL